MIKLLASVGNHVDSSLFIIFIVAITINKVFSDPFCFDRLKLEQVLNKYFILLVSCNHCFNHKTPNI